MGGVVIQPVEDEEVGDLSSRRVAAVRFVSYIHCSWKYEV